MAESENDYGEGVALDAQRHREARHEKIQEEVEKDLLHELTKPRKQKIDPNAFMGPVTEESEFPTAKKHRAAASKAAQAEFLKNAVGTS